MVLNAIRILNAAAGVALMVILFWRAHRWLQRFSEPAYLHIACGLLAVVAAMSALDKIGSGLTRYTFFNIVGVTLGWLFVLRTPVEKNFSWKERRGDPPDWDDLSRGPHH